MALDDFDLSVVAAAAASALVGGFLSWITTRRYHLAQAATEAGKLKNLEAAANSEFERAVNERVQLIFKSYDAEIHRLTEEVRLLRAQVDTLQTELRAMENRQ